MTIRIRLLADDLTGALDSAAELTGLCGPVPVFWDGAAENVPHGGSVALDSGTREASRDIAVARTCALGRLLGDAGIAFKKVDSLLRGHVAAELAALLGLGVWRHCVVAPAFPAQGRITRGGRQMARQADGRWAAVGGGSLPELLAAEGLQVRQGRADEPFQPGITVFDAETDEDLARIAALGRQAPAPVLWCGSGGLARALAGDAGARPSATLAAPVLGMFGSDQAVTARQLAECGAVWVRLAHGDGTGAASVAQLLATAGVSLVSLDLPAGLGREQAARHIEAGFTALALRLPRPGTLLAAGGETLHSLCRGLDARSLEVTGLVASGVPRSVMRGGAWDGVEVVSKSGAFGGDTLWRDLLAENGLAVGSNRT